jgi:GxxExxY protein
MEVEAIGSEIVDSAIVVHRALGPGLLESAYQTCLAHELTKRGLRVACELSLPVVYDGLQIDAGYRLDMLVEERVIVENKAVDALLPIHEAQLLTYLRMSGLWLGYLLNWKTARMRDGIRRIVHGDPPADRGVPPQRARKGIIRT